MRVRPSRSRCPSPTTRATRSPLTSAATDAVTAAPRENNEATGAPTISGTVQVGETLTADTSGISDADGLTSVFLQLPVAGR